jgi:hypothetical protein
MRPSLALLFCFDIHALAESSKYEKCVQEMARNGKKMPGKKRMEPPTSNGAHRVNYQLLQHLAASYPLFENLPSLSSITTAFPHYVFLCLTHTPPTI